MKKNIAIGLLLLITLTSCGKQEEANITGNIVENVKVIQEVDEESGELIDELIEEIDQAENDVELETEVPSEEELAEELVVTEDDTDNSSDENEEPASSIDLSIASFTGNGAEPFWGFTASGSTILLREPSDSGPMLETSYSGVTMSMVAGNINMSGTGMNLELTLGTCSDGMSDIIYDYSTEFLAGPKFYEGCANVD